MIPLTSRQQEVLDCVRSFITEKGYSPSTREIGDKLGIGSPNAVHGHIKALEQKGRITRHPKIARSIRVVEGVE